MKINEVIRGDCISVMKSFPDNVIDLTITSPPYDDLRDYQKPNFQFKKIANELFRITKEHGVVCWNVSDTAKDGNESLTSFKQALFFQEIGFNIFDTIILKKTPRFPQKYCYPQSHEYLFVLTKAKFPKTFNPIKDHKNKPDSHKSTRNRWSNRQKDGSIIKRDRQKHVDYSARWNVWDIDIGFNKSTKDKIAYKHPAIMSEDVANSCIISWSNKNDLIFDPMAGSGTTLKMAKILNRHFIGIEISSEYVDIINKRLKQNLQKLEEFC